jgi:hypothetical protein
MEDYLVLQSKTCGENELAIDFVAESSQALGG